MNRVTLFPGLPLLLGLLLSGITPIGIDAQSEATLEQIDALTRDGRVGPAREALLDWWDREWGDASRSDRERALWLREI